MARMDSAVMVAISLAVLTSSASWAEKDEVALPTRCLNLTEGGFGREFPVQRLEDDGDFEIHLRRSTDFALVDGHFDAGEEYIVELSSSLLNIGFQDFLLWLSPGHKEAHKSDHGFYSPSEEDSAKMPTNCGACLGQWIHGDLKVRRKSLSPHRMLGSTRSKVGCHGLVAQRRASPRSSKTLLRAVTTWRAPTTEENPGETCVTFHAALLADLYLYQDTGGLTKTVCSSLMQPPSPVMSDDEMREERERKGSIKDPLEMRRRDTMQIKDCCACGTATYNLTFIGLWNRTTHPKDWPIGHPNLVHWTNVIGASHSPSYQIYSIGQTASSGVRSICTYGDTTILREVLSLVASRSEGRGSVPTGSQSTSTEVSALKSLISMPGMWGESRINEQRSTLFAVNRTHPMLSLLTMLGPSPDWCTGMSSQSLCRSDCTWTDRLVINLYPWDAGVRNGNTYLSKDADTKEVQDQIRYISPDWMPGNPFEVHKPVARVTVEKVLPSNGHQCTDRVSDGVVLFEISGRTVVTGSAAKRKEPQKGSKDLEGGKSRRQKASSKRSKDWGTSSLGTNDPLSEHTLAQMATFLCITSAWSGWGRCSVTCGVGTRVRTRAMVENKKPELCSHVPLEMQESCEGKRRTCDFSGPCSLLPWTQWTPCNANCSEPGWRFRKRYLARADERDCEHIFDSAEEKASKRVLERQACNLTAGSCDPAVICGEGVKEGFVCGEPLQAFYYNAIQHECLPFTYQGCKGGKNRFGSLEECRKVCLPAVESLPLWRRQRLSLLQHKTSDLRSKELENEENLRPADICWQGMDAGVNCESHVKPTSFWYYNARNDKCREFLYYGCHGNQNRFPNHTACLSACMPKDMRRSRLLAKIGHNSDSSKDAYFKTDCTHSPWTQWGTCSAVCSGGEGSKYRWRTIIRPSRGEGRPCGLLYDEKTCQGDINLCL